MPFNVYLRVRPSSCDVFSTIFSFSYSHISLSLSLYVGVEDSKRFSMQNDWLRIEFLYGPQLRTCFSAKESILTFNRSLIVHHISLKALLLNHGLLRLRTLFIPRRRRLKSDPHTVSRFLLHQSSREFPVSSALMRLQRSRTESVGRERGRSVDDGERRLAAQSV